MTEEWRL